MQISRRHHLVPRFYLQYFANEADQVRQIWVPGDRSHLSNINNVSVINDFYSIEFDHQGETLVTDFWEHVFSDIEGAASMAFRHIVEDSVWPPSASDRDALAIWMALQRLRTTAMRDQQSELASMTYKMIVGVNGIARLRQVMERYLGRLVGDRELEAEWDDLMQPDGTHVRGDASEHIETIRRLIDPTADQFVKSGMSVWRFDRKRLVTSDSPVTLIGDTGPSGGGLGIATAEMVALAMSRFTALAIGRLDTRDREFAGTTAIAKAFNGAISWEARRWVIAHPDDDPGTLHLQMQEPRRREINSPDLSDFVHRDRPLETVRDVLSSEEASDSGSLPMLYPGWPLPGRDFKNPFSTES